MTVSVATIQQETERREGGEQVAIPLNIEEEAEITNLLAKGKRFVFSKEMPQRSMQNVLKRASEDQSFSVEGKPWIAVLRKAGIFEISENGAVFRRSMIPDGVAQAICKGPTT